MIGAKMRVYEIAREVGIPNKALISKIRALGLEVNNHMSSLDADQVDRVKRSLEKERLANTETKRLSGTVLRRRSKGGGTRSTAVGAGDSGAVVRRRAVVATTTPHTPEAPEAPHAPHAPEVRQRRAAAPVAVAPVAVAPVAVTPVAVAPVAVTPVAVTPVAAPEPASVKAPAPVAQEQAPEPTASTPEPASVPASTPEPAAVEATPAQAAATEPTPAPEPEADLPAPPKSQVFIAGPPSVDVPGRPKKPKPVAAKPAPAPAPAPVPMVTGPKTVKEVAETARNRFEEELERARERARAREQQKQSKAPAPVAEAKAPDVPRDPNRPAVGSVISLPTTRIKITERAPTRQVAGQGQIRGRFAQQRGRGRGRRDFGRKRQQMRRGGGKQTQITTPAEHKRVIRIEETILIPELAKSMGIKANEVLRKLWTQGMVGININATVDFDTAQIIASEFGYEVQNVAFKEEEAFASKDDDASELVHRAPVVTVMGHVDHGKTSLLDFIRKATVTKGEAGGITQHVAAYRVSPGEEIGDIVFLDTPGHAAFTEMRARGANTTDIVVLVVAADDGIMPQTIEALEHAKAAQVTIIVAINKCDLANANVDRVKQQLADHALIPEEWGGDTLYVEVSALKGTGVAKLLESISLSAELLELTANPNKAAVGVVIEGKLDRNRGPMATVLIQQGTVKVGDVVVAGDYFGKVRAMRNDKGQNVKSAGPSTPIELFGLDGVPLAGEMLNVSDDDKKAKQVVEHRRQSRRNRQLAQSSKLSLENLLEKIQEGETKELKVVLKADVQGSAEAIKTALMKLSTPKVGVNVIAAGVGGITESDVNLARAGNAIIVGFHVRPAGKSAKLAEKEGVQINLYDVIYEALDDVQAAMAGLLAPIRSQKDNAKLEVRDTFTIPKMGVVAGCMVLEGKVQRKSLVRVIRESVQIHDGKLSSLRRFKDDAAEVGNGYECGVMVDNFNDIQVGDIIEAYEIVETAATL